MRKLLKALHKSSGKWGLRIRMVCKAQTTAIAVASARIRNAAERLRPQKHTARRFVRSFLNGLYEGSAWVAGIAMVGVLAMVLLTVLSRLFGFSAPGADAYAGYAMAGSAFMALASTLKKDEHIRVSLLLGALQGQARRALEIMALAIAVILSAFLAFYASHLTWQSWAINDISVGIDATPLWIPQILMALGTLVFFIALCDELVLELLGERKTVAKEGAPHE